MNWPRIAIGVCALAIFFAALSYCVFIGVCATQERVEEEGNVEFGIRLQVFVDDFKQQFGRYPAPNELTNLFTMFVYAGPLPLSSQLDASGRWYYDKKSGEVRANSRRIYYIGLASRINLFDTRFRRPTKVDVSHFGKKETLDYTSENDSVDLEIPEMTQSLTNWYVTNGNFHLYVSNHSFDIAPVDIKVLIDGALVVNGDFDLGSCWAGGGVIHEIPCVQKFVFKLSPGQHKIVAESKRGRAKFEKEFEIEDKTWASLAYWYTVGPQACSPLFTLDVKREPIYLSEILIH